MWLVRRQQNRNYYSQNLGRFLYSRDSEAIRLELDGRNLLLALCTLHATKQKLNKPTVDAAACVYNILFKGITLARMYGTCL